MHWVDKICKDYRISLNELARLSGLSTGTLGNCKARGTQLKDIKWRNVEKLSNALGLDKENFVNRYN